MTSIYTLPIWLKSSVSLVRRLETEFPLREWFELAKVQLRGYVEYDHGQQKASTRYMSSSL